MLQCLLSPLTPPATTESWLAKLSAATRASRRLFMVIALRPDRFPQALLEVVRAVVPDSAGAFTALRSTLSQELIRCAILEAPSGVPVILLARCGAAGVLGPCQ